ncbi:putative protein-serine/threonine phosphatase [Helianthus annuus]|nr:putative protein-serine/threonine phosphatase [Helianthus annuus]KAJ0541865.1 putative protein-serine/threonine phosphatase [Helianthus annuus]KAJ0706940.1 putative protein-serine/threonine phosphatase [Helianthus annuus]KAJ0710959.1 putative protein-serine/threonine phosphatase [Helianthus annuus]KAJ0887574.1 putative protein-serine/threonine phosphatase [Helianthus annuus]
MKKIASFGKKLISCGKKPAVQGDDDTVNGQKGRPGARVEGLWWTRDEGVFSIAMIQANAVLEDQCQVESGSLNMDENGPRGMFVGVYDGHAGPEAAWFIKDRLFENLKKYASENAGMSEEVLRQAFLKTDEEFLLSVEREWENNPKIASVGSCCLAGVVCNGMLYVANAGDSRAVLGKQVDKTEKAFMPVRLSQDHNANDESIREELIALFPNDPNIVVFKQNIWRVRGLIQISRSIGDAYLKRFDFNKPPLPAKFIQSEPFSKPILKAEPTTLVTKLVPEDQFVIFASDGLWDHLTDQQAIDLVKSSPRNGVARKLVRAALAEAARKAGMSYSKLETIEKGLRRNIHDDITVVVLFLDCDSASHTSSSAGQSSSGGPMTLSVKSPISF